MAMKVEIDGDIVLHENSLDNSADSELLGMVDEVSYGSSLCKSELVQQQYLDTSEEGNPSGYTFRDISGAVTYKIVQMAGEESMNNITTHSPPHGMPNTEFYVIGDPADVFSSGTTQKKVRKTQTVQAKAATTKKRDDKRRATHNEVERRRRDKINNWITKLAGLVPNSGIADTASKGGILAKACDHITELTAKQKRLEKLEVDNEKLVLELYRLTQELAELRKENTSMRSQLADNCIVVNQRPKGQKS